MRYQNWDIILFPLAPDNFGNGHVPVQEFETRCYVEHTNFVYLHQSLCPTGETCGPTPILTSYVPTMPEGSNFMVSVHSWAPTGPLFRTIGHPMDDTLQVWKVRVIIDSKHIASQTFTVDTTWPQLISKSSPCYLPTCPSNALQPHPTTHPTSRMESHDSNFQFSVSKYSHRLNSMPRILVVASASSFSRDISTINSENSSPS